MFHNPKFTDLHPLVPGYVPTGWPDHTGFDLYRSPGEERSPKFPVTIHLMRADAELERKHLEWATGLDDTQMDGEDKAALEKAREYARERLKALDAKP
jgi:hypothetical protein